MAHPSAIFFRMEASGEPAAGPDESLKSVHDRGHESEHHRLYAKNAQPTQTQPQGVVIDKNNEVVRRQGAKVFTVSLLEKDALDWWETILGNMDREITLTWDDFLRKFAEKYTPPIYKNRKKVEFLELKQNNLSVADYELQFVRLSKYAPEEIRTDESKRDRFERGLRLDIHEKIAIKPSSYSALLEAALRAEETILERNFAKAKRKKWAGNFSSTSGRVVMFHSEVLVLKEDLEGDRVQQDHWVKDPFRFAQTVVGNISGNAGGLSHLCVIIVINPGTSLGIV
ncbi:UNVERIFIED_CONTAM: hypothetical protein Slati_0908300 [Sesamum latifolium]|uniref:Retrotransposon gag domain-containing protein n=1 Tax=Sesamum latifolium TaxID=2727402 RepID=A0AAW2XPN6_9LAMI